MTEIDVQYIHIIQDGVIEFADTPTLVVVDPNSFIRKPKSQLNPSYRPGRQAISDMLIDFLSVPINLYEKYTIKATDKEYILTPYLLVSGVHTCQVESIRAL